MKELSLHILDIFYNSLKAEANLIKISIEIDNKKDIMFIKIADNGCGMDKEFLKNVINPFTTTRTTRKVGLGIPLFRESALRCDGTFRIFSKKNMGTIIFATYKNSHIDRAPLGDMVDTIGTMVLAIGDNTNLVYSYTVDNHTFILDTREIREIMGKEIPLQSLDVIKWIKEYVESGVENIMEEST